MDPINFLIHMLVAAATGFIIGIEREWRLRSAGLVTNTLVAIGAAMYVWVGTRLTLGTTSGDPSRVLGQIAAGVGFLGAGVIMRDGFNIHGLNSAATIWCSAAVGSLVGLNLYAISFIAAGIIVCTNLCIRWLAEFISKVAMQKKDVNNSVIFHFYVNENHVALFKKDFMEHMAQYANLLLKSCYTKDSLNNPEKELICEINCLQAHIEEFQAFKKDIFTHPYLIKIKQDNETKTI